MYIFSKLCRLCVSNKDVSSTFSHFDADNITLLDKFNWIAPETLHIDNKLPNSICSKCTVQLNEAYEFIKNCTRSQKTFQEYLQIMQNGDYIEQNNHLEMLLNENQIELNEQINLNSIKNEEEIDAKNVDNSNDDKESNELTRVNFEDDIKVQFPTDLKMEVINVSMNINNDYESIEINDNQVECGDKQNSSTDSPTNSKQSYIECSSVKDKVKLECIDTCEIYLENSNNESPEKSNVCDFEFVECESGTKSDFSHKNIDKQTNEVSVESKKRYQCEICGKNWSYKSKLKQHLRSHSQEKPYVCDICDKAFSYSSHLKTHIRTHSNEKPYVCELCEKAFNHSSHLKSHIRIHTQEKPYTCTICQKGFSQNANLKMHLRKHRNEKPYKCEICDRAFSQSGSKKRHILTHKNGKRY